jgi:hypothetical protein
MNLDLTDMWRRLQKALGIPLIETPETKIILPTKSAGVITGIDMGTGKDESVIMLAPSPSATLKYGPSPVLASPKKFKTQWNLSNEALGSPFEAHKTIEEALRHRHVKSKRRTQNNIFDDPGFAKALMKNLTDQVAADIDDLMINGSPTSGDDITIDSITGSPYAINPPKTKYLVNPNNFVYMGGSSLFNKPRKIGFKYPTIAEALRKRHHKETTGLETIEQPLFDVSNMKPMAMKKTTFFPLLDADKQWIK